MGDLLSGPSLPPQGFCGSDGHCYETCRPMASRPSAGGPPRGPPPIARRKLTYCCDYSPAAPEAKADAPAETPAVAETAPEAAPEARAEERPRAVAEERPRAVAEAPSAATKAAPVAALHWGDWGEPRLEARAAAGETAKHWGEPRFHGKRVLVTGGDSGIGFAAAQTFYLECASVLLVGHSREKSLKAYKELVKLQPPPGCFGHVGKVVGAETARLLSSLRITQGDGEHE